MSSSWGTYLRDPQSHAQADGAPVEEAWLLGLIYASADLCGPRAVAGRNGSRPVPLTAGRARGCRVVDLSTAQLGSVSMIVAFP